MILLTYWCLRWAWAAVLLLANLCVCARARLLSALFLSLSSFLLMVSCPQRIRLPHEPRRIRETRATCRQPTPRRRPRGNTTPGPAGAGAATSCPPPPSCPLPWSLWYCLRHLNWKNDPVAGGGVVAVVCRGEGRRSRRRARVLFVRTRLFFSFADGGGLWLFGCRF